MDIELATALEEIAELKSEKGCETCTKFDEIKLINAREIILLLYNAGRDVLMCRNQEVVYERLSEAINDKRIEQFLIDVEK